MRLPALAFFCFAALALRAPDVRAAPLAPVYVTVTGHGAIRFRLTAGIVAPCDSSDDEAVYDGWLSPGAYVFLAPRGNVCMQHTFGEFRGGQWSTPVILFTLQGSVRRGTVRPVEIDVSTEVPFA